MNIVVPIQEYLCTIHREHTLMLTIKEVMPHYIRCPWFCTGSMYPKMTIVKMGFVLQG